MKTESCFATHIGLVRDENQDSVFCNKKHQIFIVADGMGGHQGGKVASQMATQIISDRLLGFLSQKEGKAPTLHALEEAYKEANKAIYCEGQQQTHLKGMGTTTCVLVIEEKTAYICNIGDSRCYMYSPGEGLWQLTEDHTFATNQMNINLMTNDKNSAASSLRDNHVLTKSVGFTPSVEPDLLERQVKSGEIYLLCSDGLTGMVPHKQIQEILTTHPLKEIPNQCVQQALKAGGIDNIAVVAVKIL